MSSPRQAGLAVGALVIVAALRSISAPPWPDDWDGVGFVESVTRFDLDHFVPHPPGYPVYVALLRVAGRLAPDAIVAANGVAVVMGVAALTFLALAAARVLGRTRACWTTPFIALAPLVWRTSTAIGSEAPALAFASAALFGATRSARSAPWWIGLSIGLGLGVRLSWAPLLIALVALAPRGARLRTVAIAAGATLAWGVPFVAIVGAEHLVSLGRIQAIGHFTVWGGSAMSEPGAQRIAWLARDVFVDGLGVDFDPLGIAIGLLSIALAWLGLRAWRANGGSLRRAGPLLVLLPYLAWVAVGQNLHQQPRHVLPIVVAVASALAVAATTSRSARVIGAAFLALIAIRTSLDAYARRTIAPPGAQLADLARKSPVPTAVFGERSARFCELDPPVAGATVGTLGEVRLALARLSPLPSRVLVTSELEGLSLSTYPLVHVATLCRPPRIERRAPCLEVFDWQAPFLKRAPPQ